MKFGKRGRIGLAVGAVGLSLAASVGAAATADAYSGAPYVRYGSTGQGAWCVQNALDAMDREDLYVVQDGQFGPATLAAVKRFQSIFGLYPDGVVGPATGTEMMDAIWRQGQDDTVSPWGWSPRQVCWNYLPTYS
ncbi:MAG: peptidoglycan-binding protein [Catenulispora sp.]|nr:peptidoglycan-binding protein [Catenulispora sp.]